jgi:hypothetical protein
MSKLFCRAVAVLAAIGAFGMNAGANDSTATLGAGGLVLAETDRIALAEEDLYVSPTEVRVRYLFRNVTGEDVRTVVAFPLPRIDLAELSEVPVDRPGDDPVNFVDFTVTVDGKSLRPAVQTRALYAGVDISEFLAARRLKLSFFDADFFPALLALDAAGRKEMMDRGYAEYDEYDNVYPRWVVETMLHWEQAFPANAAVTVEHSYKPIVGQFLVSRYSLEQDELAPFCLDEGTLRAVRKRIRERSTTADEEGLVHARNVDYILTTANNWRGPIGKFRLTLDKGAPDRLLSLCYDGSISKVDATTFVVEAADYVPKSDLRVLILE